MTLNEYSAKRNFARTPEPSPDEPHAASGHAMFVVQKHSATTLHYDLRLHIGSVMRSWAVPKGPSWDPREKRLAIETEDHPLAYASFEGVIPSGEYGAGTVMIWDQGRWSAEGDVMKSLDDGVLKFRLEGQRLRGRWMLARTTTGERQPHWILVKERDAEASTALTVEAFATSVATGRSMEGIVAGEPAAVMTRGDSTRPVSELSGARGAPAPANIRPQLAMPADRAPEGDDWFHEVKFDGYRLLFQKRGEEVRAISRSGLDWSSKVPALIATIRERIKVDCLIDGEAVIFDTSGVSDFQALQNAIHNRRSSSIVFMAFDVPWFDGFDLTRSPLEDRRRLLETLIGTKQESRLRFSEHVLGHGAAALERCRAFGLEGIVSKRRGSPYVQARSPSWLKVKCFNQQEFVIGGYSAPEGTREEFGALLLGYYDDSGSLCYAGKVGTGFSMESLKRLGNTLRGRIQSKPAFVDPPTGAEARDVAWLVPDLVCQVQFRDWSNEGVIRHPSFRGLRDDIEPKVVRREAITSDRVKDSVSQPGEAAGGDPSPRAGVTASDTPASRPAGRSARLTNPDRVVFPDRGIGYALTKRQVADYYEAVGEHLLRRARNRALAIVRCPDGVEGESFFQKHPGKGLPPSVKSIMMPSSEAGVAAEAHLMINDSNGLMALVQMNAIEFHSWGAPADDVEHPDRMILDLDPGEGVEWKAIKEAAMTVREALSQIRLPAFVRTTGGRGFHIVVPLRPVHSWEVVRQTSRAIAETLVRLFPKRFVSTAGKEQRAGRIYIDHLRNTRGATAIASYSLRARAGAPVALPLHWDELSDLQTSMAFNAISVPRRLLGSGDPWMNMEREAAVLHQLSPDGR